MIPSLLLSHYGAGECLLTKFVNRTGFLDIVWTGAFTDKAIEQLLNTEIKLTLACLPPPNQEIESSVLDALRRQEKLLLTSVYPFHLYSNYKLHPTAFINEPYSFGQFQVALESCLSGELNE
ncbi:MULTISPECIES: hypothetical protein [Spirosoma]|uniref:Uncharacterized protein n=1 Tax=Spirosoma liriopis TaxID=2937440 RepID=A0ABT0HWM9_9BACT|nr:MULTISPECIES: hypothetical protein [Spirosoma]MCK8496028.1 hypothetical protein [Spirosoma liriopis]UHG94892.1 hypothetical protein LQ777_30155 [Spirosoma oryzicola]